MKHGKAIVASAILLAVFNAIVFTMPFTRVGSFWVGYLFAMIAILLMIGVAFIDNLSSKPLQSRFYGWPILLWASIYLVIQVVLSLIFMAVHTIPIWVAVITCLVFLVLVLLGITGIKSANNKLSEIDNHIKNKVSYIKALEVSITTLANDCADILLQKKLIKLAEKIKYSDPMSSAMLKPLEETIQQITAKLSEAVHCGQIKEAGEICKQIQNLLEERNQQCKALK